SFFVPNSPGKMSFSLDVCWLPAGYPDNNNELGIALSIFATNSLWYSVIMRGFYENSQGSWMQVSRSTRPFP
ncbi:MAG: hypothetical protein P8183_24235, partial [Anaerolineae bacterium]